MNKLYVVYNLKFSKDDVLELLLPTAVECHFVNCDFSNLRIGFMAELKGKFTNCYFVGAKLSGCKLSGEFTRCSFSDARLQSVTLDKPTFEHCTFHRTEFIEVKGWYASKVYDSCKLDMARGVNVQGPYSDLGLLEVYNKHGYRPNDCIPKFINPEDTEKVYCTEQYYETFTINDKRIKTPLDKLKSRYNAVLICSKEGMV